MDENDRLTQSAAAENARLASLYAFQLLDTEPEESFDRIARLAMELLNVPVAKINLIDRDRQWCKSSIGTERREIRRDESFCNWAIRQEKPLVVRDVQDEPRFGALPQIASGPRYRFYAGAALRDGHYTSMSEVVRAALRLLIKREDAILDGRSPAERLRPPRASTRPVP